MFLFDCCNKKDGVLREGGVYPLNVDNDKIIKTQWSFICIPLILRMSIEGVGTKGRLAGVMYL